MIKLQSPAESRALPDGYADRDANPQWFAVDAVEVSRTDGFREVEIEFPSDDADEVTFYSIIVDASDGDVLLPHALTFGDKDVLWRPLGGSYLGLESTILLALGVPC